MTSAAAINHDALWHPQAHMPTVLGERLIIVAGDGPYVTTGDGTRLLDATSGLWHANVGHGRAEIADVAAAQMQTLETYHSFGRFTNLRALGLAARIVSLGPIPEAKVFWTSGGSDSVELACKLSRRYWQEQGRAAKKIVASRDKAYHGLHGFGTSVAGIEPNRAGYGSDSLIPETMRVSTNDIDAVARAIQGAGADQIAALIAEPVIGTGGVISPAPGYLLDLQGLCRENDILFIVDEVITGFGRTGAMFACERFGLTPDMVLMAKGITSGYAPLGGVLIAPRVWEPFFDQSDAPVFRHGLTYSGHATACAVAEANLDILEREKLVERAHALEPVLRALLEPLSRHELVAEIRCGAGFLAGIRLVADVPGELVARGCIERGVITRVLEDNVLQVCPPLVVNRNDLRAIAASFSEALEEAASTLGQPST